ncbi:MAG: DNA repair protein RecO [Aggregatilineaceae bacterium]
MPDRERTLRTEAVILRRQEIGEADRLLVLLTPGHGKLRALAKGARKPIARKAGHLELYALVDMQLARGREWYYVREAETRESFLPLREDLVRTAYASHLVELIDRFTGEQDASRAEFTLLRDALGWLCTDTDPRTVARYFELRLLALAGFAPALHQCVIGQEELHPRDQYFSPPDGGVICPEHHSEIERGMSIGLPALKTLRYMQTQPWEAVRVVHISATLHLELERLMLAYLTFVLEQRLQSVEFLRRLRREEA